LTHEGHREQSGDGCDDEKKDLCQGGGENDTDNSRYGKEGTNERDNLLF